MIKNLKIAAVVGAACAVFGLSGEAQAAGYSCTNGYSSYSACATRFSSS